MSVHKLSWRTEYYLSGYQIVEFESKDLNDQFAEGIKVLGAKEVFKYRKVKDSWIYYRK